MAFSIRVLLFGLTLFIVESALPTPVEAATIGIKYNRNKKEYAAFGVTDIHRLANDRFQVIMLSLSWKQWTDSAGGLDTEFITGPLRNTLDAAHQRGVKVVIANHNVYWNRSAAWTFPRTITQSKSFKVSSDVLLNGELQDRQARFLCELILATGYHPAVMAFNILNEPVALSESRKGTDGGHIQQRWEAVINTHRKVSQCAKKAGINKSIWIGQANGNPKYAEKVWKRVGDINLADFWTKEVGVASGQRFGILRAAAKFLPNLPKVRTEGYLSYAIQQDLKTKKEYYWQPGIDTEAVYFDYDAAYAYEGNGARELPRLESVFVWRIGTPDGSRKHLKLWDHRSNDAHTPYYFALRDLVGGVDSFEQFDPKDLPMNKHEGLAFDYLSARPGVSQFWSGSGKLIARRHPKGTARDSSLFAQVNLPKDGYIRREVTSSHWLGGSLPRDNVLVFMARADNTLTVELSIFTDRELTPRSITIRGKCWQPYSLPLRDLLGDAEHPNSVQAVRFANSSDEPLQFDIDNIRIREKIDVVPFVEDCT